MGVLPPAPALLGESGGALTLSMVSALASAIVAFVLWSATRRRFHRVSLGVLAVGVLLVVASFLPLPAELSRAQVSGTLTGEARFLVETTPRARIEMDGGEGRLEPDLNGTLLVLSCPGRCSFQAGGGPATWRGPPASLGGPELDVTLEGGPLFLRSTTYRCERLPFLLMAMAGGTPCVPCRETEYLVPEGGAGERRVDGTTVTSC